MESSKQSKKKIVSIIAGTLTLIPIVFLMAVPTYIKIQPELGGLPFFYWYQIMWLFLAAALFFTAAELWNRFGED